MDSPKTVSRNDTIKTNSVGVKETVITIICA